MFVGDEALGRGVDRLGELAQFGGGGCGGAERDQCAPDVGGGDDGGLGGWRGRVWDGEEGEGFFDFELGRAGDVVFFGEGGLPGGWSCGGGGSGGTPFGRLEGGLVDGMG